MNQKFLFNLCPDDRPLQRMSNVAGPHSSIGSRPSRLSLIERSIDMRRQFELGDPSRAVDWKIYARTEKLYVNEAAIMTQRRLSFYIDVSPSMTWIPSPRLTSSAGEQTKMLCSKFSLSLRTALHLADVALENEDAVLGIHFFDADSNFWQQRLVTRAEIESLFSSAVECSFSFESFQKQLLFRTPIASQNLVSNHTEQDPTVENYIFSDMLSFGSPQNLETLPPALLGLKGGAFIHTLLSCETQPEDLSSKVNYKPLGAQSTAVETSFDKDFLCRDSLLKTHISEWQQKLESIARDAHFHFFPVTENLDLESLYDNLHSGYESP